MTDLEKVIKGLECCMAEKICSSKCPYKGQCDDGGYYYSKAIEDAISLLKEQDPVKPFFSSDRRWLCGNCMREVEKYGGDYCCPGCGRKLLWE